MPGLIFNIYFASVIFGSLSSFLVGSYVFLKDPFSKINRYFFFSCLFLTIFAGGEAIGIWQGILPQIPENYLFWSKINVSGGWLAVPFFISLILLLCQKENLLKNKLFLIYLWLPCLIFAVFLLFTPYFIFIEKGEVTQSSFYSLLSSIYVVPLFLLSLYSLFRAYKKTQSFFRKKQLKHLSFGLGLPIFTCTVYFIVYHFIPKEYQAEFWSTNFIALALGIGMIIVGRGILKYGVFIDRGLLIDTLLKRSAELIIVTDKEGRIVLVSDFSLSRLGYWQREIENFNLEKILKGGKEKLKEIFQKLRERKETLREKLNFLDREGKKFLSSVVLL